jgi:hypothetical protein
MINSHLTIYYDPNVECTYHSDSVFLVDDLITEQEKEFIRNVIYRQELLNIFYLDDFDEKHIINVLTILYNSINVNTPKLDECLKLLANHYSDFNNDKNDKISTMMLLFSYTYMYLFHDCICEFIKTNTIDLDILIKTIQQNIQNDKKTIIK